MMHSDGFIEAENSENYRQAIKSERKKRGELPSFKTYADVSSQNLLESIKEEIGNLKYQKQISQDSNNSLSRMKRELTRDTFILDYVSDILSDLDVSWMKDVVNVDISHEDSEVKCVITINDIHYGWLPDGVADAYEYYGDIINKYLQKVIEFGHANFVNDFIVVNEGDDIEGNLRPSSLIDAREQAVEQTVSVTQLIAKFLIDLRANGFNVSYLAIPGNHQRINPNKSKAMDKEDYSVIHKAMIANILKDTDIEVIEVPKHYYHILEVYDNNIFLAHGDIHRIKNENLLSSLSTLHEVPLDIVMFGHLHSHNVKEVGDDKYHIITGSIKGPDNFSERISKRSSRSQVAILFHNNGEFDIRQIKI